MSKEIGDLQLHWHMNAGYLSFQWQIVGDGARDWILGSMVEVVDVLC